MNVKQIEAYMKEVILQCNAAGIPISRSIHSEIQINKRAKSRFAACRKEKGLSGIRFTIEVGEAILQLEDVWNIKNILAHELLHTCPGCYNHGAKWKAYASIMNQTYGYDIRTTSTYERLGLKEPEKKKNIKYVVICQKCGARIFRQKKSKLITHTGQYRCRCGGRLKCFEKKE